MLKNFIVNSIDKVAAANRTISHYEARLILLDKYWDKDTSINEFLILYSNTEDYNDNAYFKSDLYTQGEIAYTSAAATLRNELSRLITVGTSTPQSPVQTGTSGASAQQVV